MSNWKQSSIGEFIDFNPTESLRKNELAKKIPMGKLGVFERKINGFEISEYNSGPKFRNGDTLVAKITPCLENGKTAFVDILDEDEVAFGSSEFIVLRENSNSNGKFIYYLARSPLFRERAISCMEGTSGRKRVNEGALKRQEILVPKSKVDQQKIASVLSALDDKIELNTRINAELEAMAKLLYEYWFVQFDFPYDFRQSKPADETSKPQDIKPYKSSGGKMVWNKDLNREIPEGWDTHTLDYWIEKDKNGDWGKEEIQGNYDLRVSCIRGADINSLNGNGELKSPVRFILEKNSHKLLDPGDLVIEISGGSPTQSTGRLGYIINETLERFNEPIICSNFCKAITLKNESTQFNFIYEWRRLYDAGVFFGYEGKTSGIKNFLFESFVSKHKISIPPVALLERFYEKAITIHTKIQRNLIQNQELSSLRDWLLPMLMNGQISVADAEERVSEELGMVAEGERGRYGKK
ncbi:restriction endonuclease subunit S [Algoriphagus antarcticus]|uniref:Type I restriction enzyme S subunit n=1 Tax=Algoriphagus antarcticus TaxID=238540 RepID=A0A3E0DHF5_9BACT|nr:restriction endonuclease subunit S [Algoriphagus antarcticus]REG82027.1 type I restriction enzyme S subunit [Algoriphagus antarcticus]